MRGVVYCDTCGTSNPGGLKKCQTCNCNLGAVRNNPITSADFANRKMAVFDLDDTILDPEQRFIDARRAGVIDKDGEPKGKDGWKKRGDFLYNEDRLLKDRVMDNSMDLIEHLMEKGYVIAYCTARPFSHYEATKHQLEQKGFPMFQNGVGEDLLFCKRSLGQKTPLYKKGVMETLQAQYDVRLFFDDKPENLAAALQADVPGVYSSVKEYWNMIGVRGNPHTVEDPPPHGFYAPKPYDQDTADANEKKNPFGLFKKEKPSNAVPPKPKPVKPTPAIEKKLLAYNNALIEYSDEDEHNEGEPSDPLQIGREFVFDEEPMSGGAHIFMIYDKVAMNGMFAVLKQVGYKISDINTGESVTWKEFMKDPTSDGDRFGRLLTATKTEHHKLVGYLQHLADEGKINGRTVHYTYKDGTSAGWRFQFVFGEVKDNPRSNPPKNKIDKGKELYKHMNGKDPAKTETKVIDIGDVWYQVGEGGCWEIGYMSGKETGSVTQKYRHTFNEETKNGDFPKLYATIPDKGKPMLIITGGTWKIKTDEDGVAWIYD
jgi:hypothetical protein